MSLRTRRLLVAAPLILAALALGGFALWHGLWHGRLDPVTVESAFFGPKVVAITVDDGPSRTYTPQILAVLKSHKAVATFFVVGRLAEAEPDLVHAELAQGHAVGTHTWSHQKMDTISNAAGADEVMHGVRVVQSITGTMPTLFRPPRGVMTAGEYGVVTALKTRVVYWDESLDSGVDHSAKDAVDRVLSRLMPGDIILLHDGLGHRERDVQALDMLLHRLVLRGYKVVPLARLSL